MKGAMRKPVWGAASLCAAFAVGCAQAPKAQENQTSAAAVAASGETAPTRYDGANMAVIFTPANGGKSVILGTDELGGVDIYSMDGARLGSVEAGEAESLDIRSDVDIAGKKETLIAALDTRGNALMFFTPGRNARSLRDVTGEPIKSDFAAVGLCLHKNRLDQNLYVFVLGEGGEIDQWLLYDDGGKISGRDVRRLNLASEAGYCVANDASGDIYVSEEAVGLWRFAANPETDAAPDIVDIKRFGNIDDEVGGVALAGPAASPYLIASNASVSRLNVYDIADGDRFIGAVDMPASDAADSIEEAGGLYAHRGALGKKYPGGVLVLADDDNDGAATNYKLVSLKAIEDALGFKPAASDDAQAASPPVAVVSARLETPPVTNAGDAADDPVIWVHPGDPSQSIVIGTEKQSGLFVYDLSGKLIQTLADGKMNNVDLRQGFSLNGETVAIAAASNRTDDTLALYAIDPDTRRLTAVADGPQDTGMADPYGLCMYKSAKTGAFYAIVNDTDGNVKQWSLSESAPGMVAAKLVREFAVGSQTEGCVADDSTGTLFIGEEAVGLWKYGAEPDAGDARTAVAMIADDPALTADVEGVSLYLGENGAGYIVVSSQGSDNYALYDLKAPHAHAGSFAVIANGARGVDGSSETDGLDVTSAALGSAFPKGLLVVQDGRNVLPQDNQNFKFVSWADIEQALDLNP